MPPLDKGTIGSLNVSIDGNTKPLNKKLDRLQKGLQKRGQKSADSFLKGFKSIAKLNIGLAAAAGTLLFFANSSIKSADALAKTSAKLGVTVESLQEMRFAAERAGVQITTFDTGLQRFTRRTSEAAKGTGEAKGALEELGIQLTDNNGKLRSSQALLRDVADALSKVENQGDRVRLAFKLFDTEGVAFINILQQGSKGLDEMTKRFKELGGGITSEQARNAEKVVDVIKDLQVAVGGEANRAILENAGAIESIGKAAIFTVSNLTKLLTLQGKFTRAGLRILAAGLDPVPLNFQGTGGPSGGTLTSGAAIGGGAGGGGGGRRPTAKQLNAQRTQRQGANIQSQIGAALTFQAAGGGGSADLIRGGMFAFVSSLAKASGALERFTQQNMKLIEQRKEEVLENIDRQRSLQDRLAKGGRIFEDELIVMREQRRNALSGAGGSRFAQSQFLRSRVVAAGGDLEDANARLPTAMGRTAGMNVTIVNANLAPTDNVTTAVNTQLANQAVSI